MRRIATALVVAAGCGSSATSAPTPEVPENAATEGEKPAARSPIGYFAAGTVGQNPDTGVVEFVGNPLGVAWVNGALRPVGGDEEIARVVAAFRETRVVSGLDSSGKVVEVTIAPTEPPAQGMFTMRLGGTLAAGTEAHTVLLVMPGTALEPEVWSRATVPDATEAEQVRRLRAALAAKPPHDECGGNTYDLVEDVRAASGRRAGKAGPLAVAYTATVNDRAKSGTGEVLSALFLGDASSVEPPYLGLCKDNPAWRVDPEVFARIDGRLSVLLVISACGCEQESWQLIGTGPQS